MATDARPYVTLHQQMLRNTPSVNYPLFVGTNSVFFGFVDLCSLLWAEVRFFIPSKPAVIYGFDASEVSVARSTLIYEMMKTVGWKKVRDETILQVWFSSCWDEATKEDFEDFIQNEVPHIQNNLLQKYAAIWTRKKNMSVEDAKESFSCNLQEANFMALNNLEIKADRVWYANYLFTGCLFLEDEAVCGNCTMFPDQHDDWIRTNFENFFNTVDIHIFVKKLENKKSYLLPLYLMIRLTTASQFNRIRDLIQLRTIQCHFFVKKVDPKDSEFAASIEELEPSVIDWSNLPDYWNRNGFTNFARQCSSAKTSHRFHTMNWMRRVYGASYYDFKDKRRMLEKKYSAYRKQVQTSVCEEKYPLGFLQGWVRVPLFDFPTNHFTEYAVVNHGNEYLKWFLTEENGNVLKYEQQERWMQVFLHNTGTLFCDFTFGSAARYSAEELSSGLNDYQCHQMALVQALWEA